MYVNIHSQWIQFCIAKVLYFFYGDLIYKILTDFEFWQKLSVYCYQLPIVSIFFFTVMIQEKWQIWDQIDRIYGQNHQRLEIELIFVSARDRPCCPWPACSVLMLARIRVVLIFGNRPLCITMWNWILLVSSFTRLYYYRRGNNFLQF